MAATKKITASDYLALGLYAFAGFAFDIILLLIESAIYGVAISGWTNIQHCIHWMLVSIAWAAIGILLIRFSKKRYNYDVLTFPKPTILRFLLAAFCTIAIIILASVVSGGFKSVQEFETWGIPTYIFQIIYYIFETFVILITIAFGQKFGEMLFKNASFPFGGVFLAITWGLMHFLTQGVTTGIYASVAAFLYGLIYWIVNKRFFYAYILIAFAFIL